jgi:hypothetical protein
MAALAAATGVMAATPAAANTTTPAAAGGARPAAAAPAHAIPANTREACAAPSAPGLAQCLSLVRTDIHPRASATATAPPAGFGPSDIQSAYNLPSATAGGGQTVAVVDAFDDPNAQADLNTYRAHFGLPPTTITKVNQNGQSSPLPVASDSAPPADGWALEESLDLDMVSATCPNCNILLVEANDIQISSLGTAVNTAVALGAKYVSNSYATPEFGGEANADASFYNHPGVVVTASSGDAGAIPRFPAASPHVVAVGGTSLVRASNSRGWSESAWHFSGSGCSVFGEAKPAWQTDTGCAARTIADVSAVADPNTGVAVFDTFNNQGGWIVGGGTSASSPIIASTYALAGTPAADSYPASDLYGNPGGLNDVTTGSNALGPITPTYLCTAGPGYDGPTGLGTPNGLGSFGRGNSIPQSAFVQTAKTNSGTVEVHLDALNGGTYRRFRNATSDIGVSDAVNGQFELVPSPYSVPELAFIQTAKTNSGTVEVHLDALSGGTYQRILNVTSDIGVSDAANGHFQLIPVPNSAPELAFVRTANANSGTIETALDAFSGGTYQRILNATSDIGVSDAANGHFQLIPVPNSAPELAFLQTANTNSGTIETHLDVLSGSTYQRILNATSDIGVSDSAIGSYVLNPTTF